MKRKTIGLLVLTAAGVVFSGYLSAVKLFSGSCAFGESCPYFLGYPACWYGFAMYLAMFIAALAAATGNAAPPTAFKAAVWVSIAGIIFSGSFVVTELVLSTCAYGLAFYVAILVVALLARKGSPGAVARE